MTRDVAARLNQISQQTDIVDVRSELQQIVQTGGFGDQARFGWAFPRDGTTDAFVGAYLATHPPSLMYEPCLYPEHLKVASALLDQCLARRDQIFGLESASLAAILDHLLAETTHADELALARVSLKASRQQAGAGDGDADEEVLATLYAVRKEARATRLLLHSQPGNPLNYKERIDHLRDLMADDVRSIYERLRAARIGLEHSGAAPGLADPLAWKGESSRNLAELVAWCRHAIRSMESRSSKEITYKRAFFLGGDELVAETEVRRALAYDGAISLNFTLPNDEDYFLRFGSHRILNLGVALAGEVMHAEFASHPPPGAQDKMQRDISSERERVISRNYTFNASLILPEQAVGRGPETVRWKRAVFDTNEVQVWDSLGTQRYPAASSTQIVNTDPIGDWEIRLGASCQTSGKSIRRTALGERSGSGNARWTPTDIVIFMTVATMRP